MSVELTCPSGLRFAARKLKIKELAELAKRSAVDLKRGGDGGLTSMLSACFEDVLDPGSAYPFLQTGTRPDWARLGDGDVVVAMTQLRIATLGPMAEFAKIRCEYCDEAPEVPLELDLRDWTEKPYPEATIQHLATGTPFETKMLSGVSVRFKAQTIGLHATHFATKKRYQSRLEKAKDPYAATALQDEPFDRIARQTISVESLGEKSRDPVAVLDWSRELDLDEFYHLTEVYDAVEGGIDTKIKFKCQHCQWENLREIPLGGDFFRSPRRKPETERPKEEQD